MISLNKQSWIPTDTSITCSLVRWDNKVCSPHRVFVLWEFHDYKTPSWFPHDSNCHHKRVKSKSQSYLDHLLFFSSVNNHLVAAMTFPQTVILLRTFNNVQGKQPKITVMMTVIVMVTLYQVWDTFGLYFLIIARVLREGVTFYDFHLIDENIKVQKGEVTYLRRVTSRSE